jgi:catechol 2,3-dioxygenase-like lactoylglutathione lyase family enzyme
MMLQTPEPDRTAAFYKSVFDLRETKREGKEAVYLTDGDIALCVTSDQTLEKRGIQYFGVQVEDWAATRARFKEIGLELSPLTERQKEVQVKDPEGNLFVLSEKGWAS